MSLLPMYTKTLGILTSYGTFFFLRIKKYIPFTFANVSGMNRSYCALFGAMDK